MIVFYFDHGDRYFEIVASSHYPLFPGPMFSCVVPSAATSARIFALAAV